MARRRKVPAGLFYGFTAVLCGWVFLYFSSLFPYLGYETRNIQFFPGGRINASILPAVGTKTMFLYKGQTAFLDYDIDTTEGGGLILDVKPVHKLGFSDRQETIGGSGKGRVEFPIEKAGIYRFRITSDYFGAKHRIHYSVRWGAY